MIERTEYKGKAVLVIRKSDDDKYPFSFGIGKARLILENLEEIKQFVVDSEVNNGKADR